MEDSFLAPWYDWLRALHVISAIFWMSGMFMLPRYFAYHAEAEQGSAEDAAWIERERRLLRIIVNPSMMATFVFGLLLILIIGLDHGWLHLKLFLAFGVLGTLHGFLAGWRKAFERGENRHSSRFFRMVNEIPTFATVFIVILAIVKPLS